MFLMGLLLACGTPTAEHNHEAGGEHGHDHGTKPEAKPADAKPVAVKNAEHGHDHGEGHDHKEHADDVKTAPIPAGAKVMFTEPKDGAVVKSPVALKFGVEGMAVKPAGTQDAGTGHHHLIIGPAGIAPGKQVPKDETHIHYGKGQTEATVELPKGEHKLTMQFADGNHISFGKPLSTTITITVE